MSKENRQVDVVKFKYDYPLRPARKPSEKAPGVPVKLISNLFKLSIVQNKPIYEYCVEVNIAQEKDKGDGSAKAPRKLPSDLRRQILDQALKSWLENNKPKHIDPKTPHNYVSDVKVSVIYTLFEIFSKGQKNLKIELDFEEDLFDGKGLKKQTSRFVIGFSKGSLLEFNKVNAICTTGQTSTAQAKSIIRAVNTILSGQLVTLPQFVMTNTSIFPKHQSYQFQADRTTFANHGIFVSAKYVQAGLTVNIANTLATFLRAIDLAELVSLTYGQAALSRSLNALQIADLKKELKNKQVEARHHNYGANKDRPHYRKYRIQDIGLSAMHKFQFVQPDGKPKEITIKDYFLKEYKYNIKYPNLPCIIDNKQRKIPFEVCCLVESQRVTRKNTPNETKNIIKESAVPAAQHFQRISASFKCLKDHGKPLASFGLQFPLESIRVDGRELRATSLFGSTGVPLDPQDGGYNATRTHFLKPVQIKRWALCFLADERVMNNKNNLQWETFANRYVKAGADKGVTINPKPLMKMFDVSQARDKLVLELKQFYNFMNEKDCDHCIFILPLRDIDWLYPYLQYLEGFTKVKGKKSTRISCIKFENYMNKVIEDRANGAMFLANLLLKYNTKLGGVNFAIRPDTNKRYLSDDWLYISVDVCHPAPNDRLPQSVVGVVGMWDITNQRMSFCTRMRVQKKCNESQSSTIEEVVELGVLIKDVILSFRARKGNKFPKAIVIMRDGVSDGQLDQVIERELGQVLGVINTIPAALRPKLTCLVVQKRHKQRFKREEPFVDRRGNKDFNIQPGTVVDNTVVHPTHHDFYLAPHKAIKGTSRPAHIYFRFDQIGFGIDEAQQMILTLSYLSPRCTKSTSIPTPVNLADLAAERGKNLVVSWNDDNTANMESDDRIEKLNSFLSQIGDPSYRDSLFYI